MTTAGEYSKDGPPKTTRDEAELPRPWQHRWNELQRMREIGIGIDASSTSRHVQNVILPISAAHHQKLERDRISFRSRMRGAAFRARATDDQLKAELDHIDDRIDALHDFVFHRTVQEIERLRSQLPSTSFQLAASSSSSTTAPTTTTTTPTPTPKKKSASRSPPGDGGEQGPETTPKSYRPKIVDQVKIVLQKWFVDHIDSPYPDENDMRYLTGVTGLTPEQVLGHFKNLRHRFKKKHGNT